MISRRVIGLVVSKAGVGLIDSRMGAKDNEISTDGMMNKTKPPGSAVSISACALTMPTICTIMYSDSALPRLSFVAALFSQLSAVTYTPEKQKPIRTRPTPQAQGLAKAG